MEKTNVSFVEFDEAFLALSAKWLNDEEVKRLTNTPDFTKDSQEKWFNGLKNKSDYFIWGILAEATLIGVCGLKNVTNVDCEYWGYIGEKSYWGKGIGLIVMKALEENAIQIGLKSIWLQVIKSNKRAYNLYAKAGYEIECESELMIQMRKKI